MRAHPRTLTGTHGPSTPLHQVPAPAQQVGPSWALESRHLCSDPISCLGAVREWEQAPSHQVMAPQLPLAFAWSGQLGSTPRKHHPSVIAFLNHPHVAPNGVDVTGGAATARASFSSNKLFFEPLGLAGPLHPDSRRLGEGGRGGTLFCPLCRSQPGLERLDDSWIRLSQACPYRLQLHPAAPPAFPQLHWDVFGGEAMARKLVPFSSLESQHP